MYVHLSAFIHQLMMQLITFHFYFSILFYSSFLLVIILYYIILSFTKANYNHITTNITTITSFFLNKFHRSLRRIIK